MPNIDKSTEWVMVCLIAEAVEIMMGLCNLLILCIKPCSLRIFTHFEPIALISAPVSNKIGMSLLLVRPPG